ncbi:hypothetical protein TSOC_000657 [Tetrabaena socialis]|uniref:Uncharacterized protein n=1 Tax=Tetrabaena socialis TaxID=47790 RepID=A0A2J8AIT9_9CHLO|nr:hypothetical protein TSOC_000657 [Tetrabaena socialis]|eukprot:PNH12425.1 hypothetical protein TSOC_000657 [Tetrabaena socialis]
MSHLRLLACALLLLLSMLGTEASIYDRKRGLKTQGLSDEQIKEVAKDHDPHHINHRHKHKEGLKEHPEVKRFLEWRALQQEGHPDAAAAFTGKIPHDFIPHLVEKHDHAHLRPKEEL